ncbi:MAG: AMP-binding protein [Propionivibrio sp.]
MKQVALDVLLADGRAPDHPVCHDGNRFVQWQEFADRVATHAAGFSARPERRWLLTAGRPLEFAILLFALMHAGKDVVLPPNTQRGTLERLAGAHDAVASVAIVGEPVALTPLDPRSARIDLYTSGSTGQPKRVRKTLAQFQAEISVLECLWGEAIGDAAIVATVPHHHIYGLLFRIFWPLGSGRVFDDVTCAHPDVLIERLATFGASALVSSPAQLSRLPDLMALTALQPALQPNSWIIFSSGGPLSFDVAAEYRRQLGCAPTEVFGSTETGGVAWRRQQDDDLWTPFPGMRMSADAEGALLLRSPFLPGGPLEDAAPWRTGDAIECMSDGRFRLLGRLDRIVKIEEKRLSLPELECYLAEHPWIAAVAAVALAGSRQHVGVVLVLTATGRAQLAAQGRRAMTRLLRLHLAGRFEAVLLPRRWRFLDALPISESGKLTQAGVAALFAPVSEQDESAAA